MLSIYKASAGSGKTFTLAYRYIKLLLAYKDEKGKWHLHTSSRAHHRNILAVTFTNKSTDEMKSRIIHELALIAGRVPGWTGAVPYRRMLLDEIGCTPAELQKAADTALLNLLYDFHYFQVSTIDSFFQTILRTFAWEVDLPGDYEIDLNSEMTIRQAIDEMFASLSERSDSETRRLTEWIKRYMRQRLQAGESSAIFNKNSQGNSRLVEFFTRLLNESLTPRLDDMRRYFADSSRIPFFGETLNRKREVLTAKAKQAATTALTIIEERGYCGTSNLRLDRHSYNALCKIAEHGQSSSKVPPQIVDGTKCPYIAALAKHLDKNPDPQLEDAILNAFRLDISVASSLRAIDLITGNLFYLGLFGRMLKEIESLRNDTNTMLLSDTTGLLRGIIADDEAPFVYERIGVRLKHFLIDEFQDTSRMQWEILRPLLSEGIARGADSLIIGDVKQSIYRWRYSDPSLLHTEVASEFADRSLTIGDEPGQNTNYRSSSTVVDFNNRLFAHLAATLGFDREYANVEQQIFRTNQTGYVDLLRINADIPRKDADGMALDNMLQGIVRQIEAGWRPCDIAILTFTNNEGAEAIRYIMRNRHLYPALAGVSVISDDSMLLGESSAAKMIVSIMRFVYLAAETEIDRETKTRRKSPRRKIRGLTYRYHHQLTSGNLAAEEALQAALADNADDRYGYEELVAMTRLDTFNLQSLTEQIIEQYIIPFENGRLAVEQNLYISAFVDAVADFCATGTPDLRGFLQWWDAKGYKSEVASPAQENAIRVMTIHKSKGLEFACVHIPFFRHELVRFRANSTEWFETGENLFDIDPAIVPPLIPMVPSKKMEGTVFEDRYRERVTEQELESLNVAYVAFTRAASELMVTFSEGTSGSCEALLASALPTMAWLHEHDDAEAGTCRYTTGAPTAPPALEQRPRKITQPDVTIPMPAYSTSTRPELWKGLVIDHELDFYDPRDHGTLLHSVLQHVHKRSDLPKAVRRAVYRHRIPAQEADRVQQLLGERLDSVADRHWFEGYRWLVNERAIALSDNESARPDRVVGLPDGTVAVIDYKFGDEHKQAHARQIRHYMELLQDAGLENLTGYVWYVVTGKIVKVV